MHIRRIQLGLRETIIKMEKKGNLGNKLGQAISLEQRRLKVKISYTWLSINIKACAISLCFITCLLLLLYLLMLLLNTCKVLSHKTCRKYIPLICFIHILCSYICKYQWRSILKQGKKWKSVGKQESIFKMECFNNMLQI